MTTYHTIMTLGLAGVLGSMGILTSCASQHVLEEETAPPTSIRLERATHFVNHAGTPTQASPGTYDVSIEQESLRLTEETTNKGLLLETHQTIHDETVTAPTPLSFSEQNDEHVVMLLFPDGTAFETVGSYSGIQSRAAPQTRKRVSRATMKRQLKQRQRIPHAKPYHFTFRVPAQLNNLNPDIDKIRIQCFTFSGNDATKPDRRVGEGETIKNVTNHQFHGTIVVRFNASPGKEPENADSYHCGINFHKPGIGFRQPISYGHPAANSSPAWYVAADGTTFIRNILAPVN